MTFQQVRDGISNTGPASVAAVAPRRQVFVCGDLHNLGDLKLLLQNLALTQGRGGVVRRWAALPPAIVRQVEEAGGELVPGRRILVFAGRTFGKELVFGGGQLVRDNVSIASLAGLLLATVSARLGGGQLVTRGLGVSVIRSRLRRWLWRAVLRRCAVVNVRDEASARNVGLLLPGKAVAVHADMVFLPTPGPQAVLPPVEERRWVVVAPCMDGSEGRSLDGPGLDAAVEAALAFLPDAQIAIACHDPRKSMDKAAAARLEERWNGWNLRVFDSFELGELTELYRNAALVVTNRLHALIFAILAEAPALAIDDGTAKVRVVADRFAIPVISREAAAGVAEEVAAALAFDRERRGRVREELAARAALNLA
ncbi:polysaccharide pyruvyl transferase family protein [Novosphingobium kaempferiae]|uniref:polysaccharide pyruvyl transferase family protein n=1 Tax=Novosphingobium kaempferiae TaxID=2896849 RepID=UPI001E40F11F|nr:polysaccharide pyruvyl transferase family protein [Novosphingobium kaempferiae]